MGFTTFWSNIAGPRIKEITPSCQTSWLDRSRPATSSGARSTWKSPDVVTQDVDDEKRPPTLNSEKRGNRLIRSLSRSRSRSRTRTVNKQDHFAVTPDTNAGIPEIPALPVSFVGTPILPHGLIPLREDGRPGTAITPEHLEDLQIFELAAVMTPREEIDNPIPGRKRSKSLSEKKRKTKSWLRGSGKHKSFILPAPPPLPPSSPALPKALPDIPPETAPRTPTRVSPSPVNQPEVAELPVFEESPRGRPTLRRTHSSTSISRRPTFESALSDSDSIIGAFPPVPGLVHDNVMTPESSMASSEAGDTIDSLSVTSSKRAMRRLANPLSVITGRAHAHKDSAIGTPRTPKGPSKQERKAEARAVDVRDEEVDEEDLICWSTEEQRDWKKVSRFMAAMEREDNVNGLELLRGLEKDADRMHTATMFTNDKALSQLEFGVLNEVK